MIAEGILQVIDVAIHEMMRDITSYMQLSWSWMAFKIISLKACPVDCCCNEEHKEDAPS
jgi:hypothetical protein